MDLNSDLLFADKRRREFGPFRAVTNAHGQYSTLQFVLRLSPVVYKALASTSGGVIEGPLDFSTVQAMSTFLHETIHWWQHIGSTYGFVLSLNYPMQTHVNHSQLKEIVSIDGFKKSILKQSEQLYKTNRATTRTSELLNIVINNHYDLLVYRGITLNETTMRDVVNDPRFDSVGHAFHMTLGNSVRHIASTVDPKFKLFQNPDEWHDGFLALRNQRVDGFYRGSQILQFPVGSQHIFEGQAAISQAQFLSYSCNHTITWNDVTSIGLLRGIYVDAFNNFLEITHSNQPQRLSDPLIGLFLLICDISLNPSVGLPLPMVNYKSLIFDCTPGARFHLLCLLVRDEFPDLKTKIVDYSRQEYEEVAGLLCTRAKEWSPLRMAELFKLWFAASGPLSSLRTEYESYNFGKMNFIIRHLFAHFLAFQEDKFARPEFFCWPGAWMAGERVSSDSERLFYKHGALFGDKEDDDSVFPRVQPGRSDDTVHKVFEEFFGNTVVFDLVNQWIGESGSFRYDINWLKASASVDEMSQFMRRQFKAAFELDPEDALIL